MDFPIKFLMAIPPTTCFTRDGSARVVPARIVTREGCFSRKIPLSRREITVRSPNSSSKEIDGVSSSSLVDRDAHRHRLDPEDLAAQGGGTQDERDRDAEGPLKAGGEGLGIDGRLRKLHPARRELLHVGGREELGRRERHALQRGP